MIRRTFLAAVGALLAAPKAVLGQKKPKHPFGSDHTVWLTVSECSSGCGVWVHKGNQIWWGEKQPDGTLIFRELGHKDA